MSYRKYLKHLILALISMIILCIAFVVYIDPAFQYHVPFDGINSVYLNERYQNAGMAKNFDYDSVVLGSSVTSNFKVSEFDEYFGGKTLKLTFPGGCFSDFNTALSTAFDTHDIKRVFWSIDPNILVTPYNQTSVAMPEFLYNDLIFDDTKYLLNKDVILELCGETIDATINNTYTNLDDAFAWHYNYDFENANALDGYLRPEWSETVISEDYYDDIIDENLSHVHSFINEHPETEFYLFTPPYSILHWDKITRNGTYPAFLKLYDRLLTEFSEYHNVKYYCFAVNNFIFDLSIYIDEVHYSPDINSYIVQYMANNNGVDESLKKYMHIFFKDIIENFNFESLLPKSSRENPAKHRVLDSSY